MSQVHDERRCLLGEGPLWHPERQQLFWFDILGKKLLSQKNGAPLEWQFDEHVSAAGWIDRDHLLIASETRLFRFNLETSRSDTVCALEASLSATRSNDGRADARGGFWIGTMGKDASPLAGSIYRFYKGELRFLFKNITISNAICFSPDGKIGYFADTAEHIIWTVPLDEDGWPAGDRKTFLDLRGEDLHPDGAVIDADGTLWNAQWGAYRVAQYGPDGAFLKAIQFEAEQVSCPAFGGAGLTTLFATTAAIGLTGDCEGKTYSSLSDATGQPEHQVRL